MCSFSTYKGWAKKVFKDAPEDEAVDKLWNAIFKTVRADQDDVIAAGQSHLTTETCQLLK